MSSKSSSSSSSSLSWWIQLDLWLTAAGKLPFFSVLDLLLIFSPPSSRPSSCSIPFHQFYICHFCPSIYPPLFPFNARATFVSDKANSRTTGITRTSPHKNCLTGTSDFNERIFFWCKFLFESTGVIVQLRVTGSTCKEN